MAVSKFDKIRCDREERGGQRGFTVAMPDGTEFDRMEKLSNDCVRILIKNKAPELGPYRPKGPGTMYWRSSSQGGEIQPFYNNSDTVTDEHATQWDTYEKEKHAEKDAKYLRAIRKLRRLAHLLNPEGWEPEQDFVWGIYNDGNRLQVMHGGSKVPWLGIPRFHSEEAAKRALDELTAEEINALQTQY